MKKTLCLALALCLTFAGSAFAAPSAGIKVETGEEIAVAAPAAEAEADLSSDYNTTPYKEFTFDSDTQGWSAWGSIACSQENGTLKLVRTVTSGTDGAINSPTSMNIDATNAKNFVVRVKNETTSSQLKVYFSDGTAGYSEANTFILSMPTNMTDYEYVSLNLSSYAGWTGTINKFMVAIYSTEGSVYIDSMAFYKDLPPYMLSPTVSYDFTDGNKQGWSVGGAASINAVDGDLVFNQTISSGYASMYTPAKLGMTPATGKYLAMRYKNTSSAPTFHMYFQDASAYSEANSLFAPIESKMSDYKILIYDMTSNDKYAAMAHINQFMLNTGANDGSLYIDSFAFYSQFPGYTVKLHAGTTDTVTSLPAFKFASSLEELAAVTPVREGYKFIGWSQTENGTVLTSLDITADTDLYAVWKVDGATEITLPEKVNDADVRFVQVDGVTTALANEAVIYSLVSTTPKLVVVTEKASAADVATVATNYYFVDGKGNSTSLSMLDDSFNLMNVSGIRTSDPTGMRFCANITNDARAEETAFTVKEYGFMVARADKLAESGSQLTMDFGAKVTGVSYIKGSTDRVYSQTEDKVLFTGVLTGIPKANYTTDLTARTYIKVAVGENEFTIYGEAITNNIFNVAVAVLKDPDNGLSNEALEVVKDIVRCVDPDNEVLINAGPLYPQA